VQEALTNVLRHAGPGAAATVRLRYASDGLALTVTDTGSGSGPASAGSPGSGGHGINGMRERAAAVGGTFTAGPGTDGGFQVTAELPAGGSA
jgi:signal transduction histidine kinase